MKHRRFLLILLVLMLTVSLLAGCGSKNAAEDYDMGYVSGSAKPEAPQDSFNDLVTDESASVGSAHGSTAEYQKKIRNLEMHAETEDLDALLQNVETRVNELGGYVEQQEVYRGSAYANRVYRHANMTLRIPAEKADAFVEKVGEISNITSTFEDVDDVTLQYVATESRITALKTEETRLLELLAQAKNMEDLLLIESRLTDVRTELEEYTSQLRLFDNLVNYATIRLNVDEVREYTPVKEQTFWQRIGSGLQDNLKDLGTGAENFVVFLITSLPYLVLIAAGLTVLILLLRAWKKRRLKAKKHMPPQES